MALSTWTPKTPAQLAAIFATAFNSQPDIIPINTDPASTGGALSDALAMLAAFIQNELAYTNNILRLGTIPPNADGSVSPDAASFGAPFNIIPLSGEAAIGAVVFSTPSIVSQMVVVPIGAVVANESGVQYEVVADPTNLNYVQQELGYPINIGESSVSATVECVTPGIAGNVPAGAITQAISNVPPAITTINNPSPFTNGAAGESNNAYKARFAIAVSSGNVATINAIIAAALGVQTGIIYSFGDRANADGSEHDAYFTFVVNIGGSGTNPPSQLIASVSAAIDAVRAAGISYQVIGPTLITVNAQANITPAPGFASGDVLSAVQAQYATFVNAIGLKPDTTPTTCSIARCYASLLATQINGVNCVLDVQTLKLNGANADLTAPFASQFVAGSGTFTVL